jgi:hypothetical protein
MKYCCHFLGWCLVALGVLPAPAQNIPVGTWRPHPSFRSLQTLAVTGERVYAATEGGLFRFDPGYGNTQVLSRLDGLTGTNVSRLAYAPDPQVLIVAYTDGNVDVWDGTEIQTVTALARANLTESKRINHLSVAGRLAYLAGDFGVAVLDLERKNIRETYRNIGPGGTRVAVRATAAAGGNLYLATEGGLLRAAGSGTNLQDFRSWSPVAGPEGVPAANVRWVAPAGNALCAAFDGGGVFLLENGVWQKLDLPGVSRVNGLTPSPNGVLAAVPGGVWVIRPGQAPQRVGDPALADPREAAFDAAGKLWVADGVNGLVSNWEGSFSSYSPAGPLSNAVRRVVAGAGQVVALPGGFGPAYAPKGDTAGVSFFTEEGWRNYAARLPGAAPLSEAKDFLRAAYNPTDGSWYLGSYGNGLLVLGADGSVARFDEENSPLRASTEGGVRVTGLAVDSEGNAWVALYGVPFGAPSLFVRRRDGTWGNFSFSNIAARFPLDLVLDDAGNKWMPLAPVQGGGLWVFDDKGNRTRYLSAAFGSGGLPNAYVTSLASDREGQMWVGTERGAAVFFAPADVLRGAAVDATVPVYEGSRLLRDEVVTAIAVDGGNRKWFGTRNGVFLFNPTTDKLVSHFTAANSPLPADSVASLVIQGRTGEVFVATAGGLVSYRAAATEADPEASSVQIFPNPVRPGFEGLVGISGLPQNALVKITDVSGRLVHETRAQGGTAAWNLRDYRGRRAATGIYLVYAADAEGRKLLVGKMAVIE